MRIYHDSGKQIPMESVRFLKEQGYMVAAVIKEQKSKRNPAFKYYVLEAPE